MSGAYGSDGPSRKRLVVFGLFVVVAVVGGLALAFGPKLLAGDEPPPVTTESSTTMVTAQRAIPGSVWGPTSARSLGDVCPRGGSVAVNPIVERVTARSTSLRNGQSAAEKALADALKAAGTDVEVDGTTLTATSGARTLTATEDGDQLRLTVELRCS